MTSNSGTRFPVAEGSDVPVLFTIGDLNRWTNTLDRVSMSAQTETDISWVSKFEFFTVKLVIKALSSCVQSRYEH